MSNQIATLRAYIKPLGKKLAASQEYITSSDYEPSKWKDIPNAQMSLLPELQKMYWGCVRQELVNILLTLKAWRHPDCLDVELEDERDSEIYGFDTFIDQVNESSRDFAVQYAREKASRMQQTAAGDFIPQEYILQGIARKFLANLQSKALKDEIKEKLKTRAADGDILRRRARMLLQSAGWLDIDKFIEYRPPLDDVEFWRRPMPPQLTLERFYSDLTPVFQPLHCVLCTQVIRGCMFECTARDCLDPGSNGFICQDCQDEGHGLNRHAGHLKKHYKHCILTETIDPIMSRKICKCNTVSRYDVEGRTRSLFPIQKVDSHRNSLKGAVQCGLLDMGDLVAEAKYSGIQIKIDKRRTLDEERSKSLEKGRKLQRQGHANRQQSQISTELINEKDAKEDIPFFMRKFTDRYPFGNVHMALRFGPLHVENGVRHTQGGAFITSRDPPNWQVSGASDKDIGYSLALNQDRSLYWQNYGRRKAKRYKTALKQVVGGLFNGMSKSTLERDIIDLVISGSEQVDNPDDGPRGMKKVWQEVLDPIVDKLKTHMQTRVDVMLQSISQRLLDTKVNLHWNRRTNNCQMFCDNLVDYSLYGNLLAPDTVSELGTGEPLYLLSFICRPGSYTRERKVQTKYDVPSGLCEEYLLKSRYGLHVDSDIIDSLQDYWYDWGAFGGPLYKYQNLFPWDCTEAYGRSHTKCGDCNISKHVWSFPFDSLSIAELHFTRSRLMYPEVKSKQGWVRNRLTVLLAQDVLLTGAKAMAESKTFHKSTAWILQQPDPRVDRLKLGGIHRAQPFSHQYEQGQYHEYFIADWACLQREDQRSEYEAIRDVRRQLPDVQVDGEPVNNDSYNPWGSDDSGMWLMDGMLFAAYYSEGWDGSYAQNECMSASDAAVVGSTDPNATDGWGDDSGGDGGGCGGGCGGD
ncbi:hypothetical protein B0O99DRAFT_267996 [Bisporella sp. PMI_857]|nr:hypothetical protein B0O99DRAFT_267996 [Bisporella sp. PMI_857]